MQVKLSLVMVLFLFLACSSVLALDLDGLVLFLGFDESSGDTAADGSDNGNDGEVSDGQFVAGKFGNALQLDGSGFVEVPSSDSLESLIEEMTVAAWIKPDLSGSGWQGVVTKGNDAAEHFEMLINTDGHIHTAQMFAAGRGVADRQPPVLSAGEWQHIAVTYAPGAWIFYYNGEEIENNESQDSELVPDGNPIVVGDERPANRLFEGLIDEVVVFNRAISPDELAELMLGMGDALSVSPQGKLATSWSTLKSF